MTQQKTKIIAFPFAGGSKYSYRLYENSLTEQYEWETIELAGRGSRIIDEPIPDIKEMANDIFPKVIELTQNEDYIFYGHSMGTLLGYELTKLIIAQGYKEPSLLFFTGRGAPEVEKEKKISHFESESFWHEIKEMGGLPQDLMENDELKEFFEPIIRSDFKAVEEYTYQPPTKPFDIPISIITGREEEISDDNVTAWQKESNIQLKKQKLSGNHFFIFDHPDTIVKEIVSAHQNLGKAAMGA